MRSSARAAVSAQLGRVAVAIEVLVATRKPVFDSGRGRISGGRILESRAK
jgi:hypothetical protein